MSAAEALNPNLRLVRLKPFNRKLGHVLRTYMVRSIKFLEEKGWYPVEDQSLLAYLGTVRQVHNDPLSPLAFDICTPEEALALDEAEEEEPIRQSAAAIVRAKLAAAAPRPAAQPTKREAADSRGDLTTADLAKPASGDTADDAADGPESAPAPEPEASKPKRRSRRRGG